LNEISKLFESPDFLYVPAPDIEASSIYYTSVLGCKLLWKLHALEVWVACIHAYFRFRTTITSCNPHNDLIMIYRVNNLDDTASTLRSQGWKEDKKLEIPPGACYTFRDPARNAIAIYENQRPEVVKQFNGRIDKK
jgi:hypothetical protein